MERILKNDFYTVKQSGNAENTLKAIVALNPGHEIFQGHFPQMPIVPGVCQAQIIKELLEEEMDMKLFLHIGNNIKFTGMIIPTQHPEVHIDIVYDHEGDEVMAEAKLYFENTIFTKYKGVFKVQK
jgi:3-hydroxyacyl-[acyl-carrier-protein] dehydratase